MMKWQHSFTTKMLRLKRIFARTLLYITDEKHLDKNKIKISKSDSKRITLFQPGAQGYTSVPFSDSENTINSTLKIDCNRHRQTMEWYPGNTNHNGTQNHAMNNRYHDHSNSNIVKTWV